ncbi:helix-turn-helix domain-containing protein [Acinetobacter guillouiae]|uniref:helix-turn-helix domain-containing protein n=1 Tax=Acinetobacter guillouiae TaxID=106649 RepID=UPI0021D04BB6|nr:helix-turn-helix transcriptional regulator [Acinetobacter guillouiae]MCU4491628.1 helix-turn-helix domain-containing protein [Acinetobacter guillouiae]
MKLWYQDLIKKLIELRESKHVTQVELARLLNKPQSYVSKVEILERRLDVIELCDWLKVLDKEIMIFINQFNF